MKKVLCLVLALTMIVGFASTAFATYYGNYIKYDLLTTNTVPTVGGLGYTKDMYVDGNKEYTVKKVFTTANLNTALATDGGAYDALYTEYLVLTTIDNYTGGNLFTTNGNWVVGGGTATDITSGNNAMCAAVEKLVGGHCSTSAIYNSLINAFSATNNTFKLAYNSTAFQTAMSQLRNNYNYNYANGFYGYDKAISAIATPKDGTYATITSPASVSVKRNVAAATTEYTVEFKVKFTNTTFKTMETDIELVLNAGTSVQQAYFETKETLEFTVFQAQSRTFTAQDATIAFGSTPNVEISAKDYAYISADAFRIMLSNASRSLTVVNGMGNSKVRFDKDSTNLPQDVFVGNFATTGTATNVATLSGFSSTTAAKIKIAVGDTFKNAMSGKVISLYDGNKNKLDTEVTLQGDNTVNFFAPLSSYTVAASDWDGQVIAAAPGKTNPSMGGK